MENIPMTERKLHLAGCYMTLMRAPVPATAATSAAPPARRNFPCVKTKRFLLHRAEDIMHYTNDWDKTTRILARLMKGLLTCDTQEPPTSAEFRAARNLQFLAAAAASTSALMQSLSAVKIKGEVWIQGRFSPDDMAAALGCTGLRVIMPNARLAFLIMNSCHQEDHRRDPRNAMARAMTIAWIPRSRQLAVKVVKGCYTCRQEEKRLAQQQIGELPGARAGGIAPFEAVACDFMGPYEVTGMCSGRRRYKVWVAVYTYFSSRYSVLLATPGYEAATFLTTHLRFCYTYAPPKLVQVDPGPNLVAAAERPDWQEVVKAAGYGDTEWRITPKGSPWRHGQVERSMGMAKTSLHRLLGGHTFSGDFHQLEALLKWVSWLLNSRPIATHSMTEWDFHLITPNDIVLGRAARPRGRAPSQEELEEPNLSLHSLGHMEQVARAWHSAFIKQAWPLLVPCNK